METKTSHSPHAGIKKAIKLAIAKGEYAPAWWPDLPIEEGRTILTEHERCILDPLFWQALGKALGNNDVMRCNSPKCDSIQCEYAGYKDPHRMFESYMNLKWYGGDEEKFWLDLISHE